MLHSEHGPSGIHHQGHSIAKSHHLVLCNFHDLICEGSTFICQRAACLTQSSDYLPHIQMTPQSIQPIRVPSILIQCPRHNNRQHVPIALLQRQLCWFRSMLSSMRNCVGGTSLTARARSIETVPCYVISAKGVAPSHPALVSPLPPDRRKRRNITRNVASDPKQHQFAHSEIQRSAAKLIANKR